MYNYLKLIRTAIKEYGIVFAIKFVYLRIIKHNKEQYVKYITKIVTNELQPLISKYNDMSFVQEPLKSIDSDSNVPVWVCWFQGYDNMPEICRICFKRLNDTLPSNAELHLLTMENYEEYIHINPHIVELLYDNKISYTHFSDVVRNNLLAQKGGFWIDATVFVSSQIEPSFFNETAWWSVKLPENKVNYRNIGQVISQGMFCSFLQKSQVGNPINCFVCDAFDLYFEKHNSIVEYFLQNLFIRIAYENIPYVNKIISDIPVNNMNLYELMNHIEKDFDNNKFSKLSEQTTFFKLTWKYDFYCAGKNSSSGYSYLKGLASMEVY